MQQMHTNAVMRPEAQRTSSENVKSNIAVHCLKWFGMSCSPWPCLTHFIPCTSFPFNISSPLFASLFYRDVTNMTRSAESLSGNHLPVDLTHALKLVIYNVIHTWCGCRQYVQPALLQRRLVAGRLFQPQARKTTVQL